MPENKKQGRCAPLSVSQNFLTSAVTINNILKQTTIGKDDHVLEIGPGKGHITRALLRRSGRVTAVELDGGLARALRDKFAGETNLRLVHLDFLKYRLPDEGGYKVFASIPFNRTTAILRKLTECRNPPEEMWLVVEEGAAKRFLGRPAENLRSLLLKPYFDMDIAYYLPGTVFHPKPKVDAVLLHLKKKQMPDISGGDRQAYRQFIEAGLSGGGQNLRRLFTPKQLTHILKSYGCPTQFTPAQLLYVQWLCLFRCRRDTIQR
ncbi:23S rRNA (adenine-N6)-dimethyltransferase [Sporobacter termitidis DSM 10068]|uniref:rRNA adenine N-6-methyltransferase n=1 Tax=Sporobacter termitidis DSM 10068 TaxID=1123282 RepID=A0A1M5Y2T4_9FIRM|nr:23S ribosomal RNA methyltransferase Erm [Sporobacter termitidis]SHI06104.1 23S rRNA (adenine-N6)-dimethyltransferase [Sporobacter termitidis DSM 10068]